jgi:putative phosphoesterase
MRQTAAMTERPRRVAALYDTHGNVAALEAVLGELAAARPDLVVFGGDTVNGPFPRETLARLQTLDLPAVQLRGNGERGLLSASEDAGDRWCAGQLDDAERSVLASFQTSLTLDLPGLGRTLFCHAAPDDDEQIVTPLTPDDVLRGVYGGLGVDLVVLGHTHVQLDRRVDGLRLVNPGSVGWPYADGPGAYWALLEDGRVELRRTGYDLGAAAAAIAGSDWPGAEAFARDNVLAVPSAAEASAFFERQREERAG